MKEHICDLTEEETKEIQVLFEKKMALEALFKSLYKDDEFNEESLYRRLVEDYVEVNTRYTAWWNTIFNIKSIPDYLTNNIEVDFINRCLVANVSL